MQKLSLIFLLLFSIAYANTNVVSTNPTQNLQTNATLQKLFSKYDIKGTLIINIQDKFISNNVKRVKVRYMPASTFKIYNALFGLDLGVVRDNKEIFYRYHGEPVSIESWKRDANLKSGMQISQVPAFQELARKIGRNRMQSYLNKIHYGNEKIGKDVSSFWLDDSLQISAIEQLELITLLSNLSLPISKKAQKEVIEIIKLEDNNKYKLYGKTGLSKWDDSGISWFVGFIEINTTSNKIIYPFAFNANYKSLKNYAKTYGIEQKLSQITFVKECLEKLLMIFLDK